MRAPAGRESRAPRHGRRAPSLRSAPAVRAVAARADLRSGELSSSPPLVPRSGYLDGSALLPPKQSDWLGDDRYRRNSAVGARIGKEPLPTRGDIAEARRDAAV